jgi:hypothetical protein
LCRLGGSTPTNRSAPLRTGSTMSWLWRTTSAKPRAPKQRLDRDPSCSRPLEIVAGQAVRSHSRTTSPGFQSGFRSQYS